MSYGGGNYVLMNKVLPGSYINFVSKSRASVNMADRGYATMAMELDWGPDGEIFTVENGDFQKDSVKIFGYDYTHEKMKPLRDLFKGAKTAYLYKLNSGVKAKNDYAEARYTGVRGNSIKIVIQQNVDEDSKFDVTAMLDDIKIDFQTVAKASELIDNDYIIYKKDANLTKTAGVSLAGGTNGEAVTGANHQSYLDAVESYSFNTMGCTSLEKEVKDLYVQFTKRMRDEVGVKFQTVVYRNDADYEGVINVQNRVLDEGALESSAVFWVTGAEARCNVNASVSNKKYDGDYDIDTKFTQSQLEAGIKAGQFLFHRADNEIYVLTDINSLVSITTEKNDDFQSNQVIRVLDQIGNDIAVLFNKKHNGKSRNNNSGREALWKDIVAHHQELERVEAIENFDPKAVTVEKGPTKKSVIVTDPVTPVACLEILYMTVIVA